MGEVTLNISVKQQFFNSERSVVQYCMPTPLNSNRFRAEALVAIRTSAEAGRVRAPLDLSLVAKPQTSGNPY